MNPSSHELKKVGTVGMLISNSEARVVNADGIDMGR
jgi:hypothetical protein